MGELIRAGPESRVFLGADIANKNRLTLIQEGAGEVRGIIGEHDKGQGKIRAETMVARVSGGQFNRVEALNRTINKEAPDSSRKEELEGIRTGLGQMCYLAMRNEHGSGKGGSWLKDLFDPNKLGIANPAEVNGYLTVISGGKVDSGNRTLVTERGALTGLGEAVRSCVIANKGIQGVLGGLEASRKALKLGDQGDRGIWREEIAKARDRLQNLSFDDTEVDSERRLAIEYLMGEEKALGEMAVSGGSGSDAMTAYYERQARIGEMVEATSQKEWLEALIYKLPKTRPGALWEYSAPGWVLAKSADEGERRAQWRRLIETVDGLHVGTLNRRNSTEFNGGGVKGVAETVMNLPKIQEGDLKYLYEKQRGFREALETVVKDLFDEKVIDRESRVLRVATAGDVAGGMTTFYVFKDLSRGRTETRAGMFVRDFGSYKTDLAMRLQREKGLDLEQAQIMISAAVDFLEQGGAFEFADTERKATFISDGARTVMRPREKFRQKLRDKERFGGNWSTYFRVMMGNVPENQREQRVVDEMDREGYIPAVLSGSVLNQKMYGNGKVMLGKLLYRGVPVRFAETSSDILYSTKKTIKAACDFWSCVAGGAALEFRDFAEFDNVVTKWVDPLANAIGDIHGFGIELSAKEIAGAIGGAAGLWPFEGPYIRIARYAGNLNFKDNYAGAGQEIVAQLGLDEEKEKQVKAIFGFDNKTKLRDMAVKCSNLAYELNPNASARDREGYRKKRLHL